MKYHSHLKRAVKQPLVIKVYVFDVPDTDEYEFRSVIGRPPPEMTVDMFQGCAAQALNSLAILFGEMTGTTCHQALAYITTEATQTLVSMDEITPEE